MNYNKLSDLAHQNAVEKGFWECEHNESHWLSLIISEVCEAIEADRKDRHAKLEDFTCGTREHFIANFQELIKDTLEDEFADAMIRLFDLAGHLQIDFERLPACKYYRAFGRFSFTENAFGFIKGLTKDYICIEKRVQFALEYLKNWTEYMGIEIEHFIRLKMQYNSSREPLHGKKY